jgi:hypothetical protein
MRFGCCDGPYRLCEPSTVLLLRCRARYGADVLESGLILPVPEVQPLVDRWRIATSEAAQLGAPAHVTLLFPWLPAPVDPVRAMTEAFMSAFPECPLRSDPIVTPLYGGRSGGSSHPEKSTSSSIPDMLPEQVFEYKYFRHICLANHDRGPPPSQRLSKRAP